jgi:hypothetical protein
MPFFYQIIVSQKHFLQINLKKSIHLKKIIIFTSNFFLNDPKRKHHH